MAREMNSTLQNVFGWVIVLPFVVVFLVFFSPVLLYFLLIHGPVSTFKKYKFLKRNAGKRILCVSAGRKFQTWRADHWEEILVLGIDDVVVFDSKIADNQYDNFEWDRMIARDAGFPVLITINGTVITQQSLKIEFLSFFKKEIDWMQLQEFIRRKVDGNKK
jgi:hypothetical protein